MKLEINKRKKNVIKNKHKEAKPHETEKQICHWGNRKRNKKDFKTNDNENTTILNLWDAAKAFLRGKFKAVQAFLEKQEKSQINIKRTRNETTRNSKN